MQLETERLFLRPWRDSDAKDLYEYAKDPKVGPIAGWPPHTSVENSREIIKDVLSAEETYAVCFKGDDKAIGSVGLMIGDASHLHLPHTQGEIGYWIGVPFWGQGLIPEAVKELLRHGFEDLNLQKIWCGYFEGNVKSKRVQEKCGFLYHHRNQDIPWELTDDIRTEYITCLTQEQWRGEERKKIVIITGANSGLGLNTAIKIAKTSDEYKLILACRNVEKAEKAKQEVIDKSGNQNIEVMNLDLSSLASVRSFVNKYETDIGQPIYALLCNAGINGTNQGFTKDGFDVVFQSNHLGHFLLTNLLLPHMEPEGRIFVTSSDMHDAPTYKMDWKGSEALAHPTPKMAENTIRYSYSKLCNLYFVYELARKLSAQGVHIRVNAFNPGLMETNFMTLTKASILFVKKTMPNRFGDLEKSSTALAELVTSPNRIRESGLYFDRSTNPIPSSKLSYNEVNARELWKSSEQYVNLSMPEKL